MHVADEHLPWARFFGSQGPYEEGGAAALARINSKLVARLQALLLHPPATASTPEEDAAALLHALEREISLDRMKQHDEL